MKKKLLVAAGACSMLLASCTFKGAVFRISKSARKHWDHGTALLDKWIDNEPEEEKKRDPKFELKKLSDHFYEAGIYTVLDYEGAQKYFANDYDNWEGGCSAVSAVVGGKRLVGRNMDLNISKKNAYVVETQIENKYKTVGLSYTFRDVSPDLPDFEKNGLGVKYATLLPFMCDDVLNSEGLHIELNMRPAEHDGDGNGVFDVEHTNAQAKERIYIFSLCQYLGLNCKDLSEVKQYLAKEVDVYNKKGYWNYSFLITDAKGNSNLLEFAKDKYYFVEPNANGVVAQANFYVNSECNSASKIKNGLGRYEAMMNGISSVKNKTDLFNLMKKIQYSSFYLPYEECKASHFDPRSELISEEYDIDLLEYLYESIYGTPYAGSIPLGQTEEFVMAPENEEFVAAALEALYGEVRTMTREQKAEKNEYWESTFTEVVDPAAKTIEVRVFENDSALFKVTLDGVTKIESI